MNPCLAYVGTEDGLRSVRIADDGLDEVGSCVHGNVVRDLAVDPRQPQVVCIGCGTGAGVSTLALAAAAALAIAPL